MFFMLNEYTFCTFYYSYSFMKKKRIFQMVEVCLYTTQFVYFFKIIFRPHELNACYFAGPFDAFLKNKSSFDASTTFEALSKDYKVNEWNCCFLFKTFINLLYFLIHNSILREKSQNYLKLLALQWKWFPML